MRGYRDLVGRAHIVAVIGDRMHIKINTYQSTYLARVTSDSLGTRSLLRYSPWADSKKKKSLFEGLVLQYGGEFDIQIMG